MEKLKNGFGWEPKSQPMTIPSGILVPTHKAIVNDQTGEPIFCMSKGYNILSNEELTARSYELAESIGSSVRSFSTFKGGRVVMAQIDNPHSDFVIEGSPMKSNIVIGNSFDGTKPIFIGSTDTYVRCKNQFGRILKAASIRHQKDQSLKLEDLVELVKIYFDEHSQMLKQFERMANFKIDDDVRQALIESYFDIDSTLGDEISTRKSNQIVELNSSIDREVGALGETAWGLFNGITFHNTHVVKQKGRDEFGLFGLTAIKNEKAYQFLTGVMEHGLSA